MSHAAKAYSQFAVNAWTVVSLIVTFGLWIAYACGSPLLHFFRWVWDLVRYICSPII